MNGGYQDLMDGRNTAVSSCTSTEAFRGATPVPPDDAEVSRRSEK
jgi:hypothetical protein